MAKPWSAHRDTFARDNLPPDGELPVFEDCPNRLCPAVPFNCGQWLLDGVLDGAADKPAIFYKDTVWTYDALAAATNQLCHVLTEDLGVVPGNRILLRGANTPMLFALWLAVMKVGAIAVSSMPMLRRHELQFMIAKAQVTLALCEEGLLAELADIGFPAPLQQVLTYNGADGLLERAMAAKPTRFTALPTNQNDVCLIAFTSGTTGLPKATMHMHRDMLAMCETFARTMIAADQSAVFTGTPPIGFTFGLGALLVFPLYFRAAVALPDAATPQALAETIARHRASHVFTVPTAYKMMMRSADAADLASLRVCVSAGEALSRTVSDAWHSLTGLRLIDGIGGTEMTHIFISAQGSDIRPGATGKPVPGYRAALFDAEGRLLTGPAVGRLGVQGPTGCRYLNDPRQREFVYQGWNMTGDVFRRDEDGYYWYVARADDMIVSSGYNIAGPEVEAALALHPAVEECAVVGWPDAERGQVVKAVIVPRSTATPGPELAQMLQDHVKAMLAPYKYPRHVEFAADLPKTMTGKLHRHALRAHA